MTQILRPSGNYIKAVRMLSIFSIKNDSLVLDASNLIRASIGINFYLQRLIVNYSSDDAGRKYSILQARNAELMEGCAEETGPAFFRMVKQYLRKIRDKSKLFTIDVFLAITKIKVVGEDGEWTPPQHFVSELTLIHRLANALYQADRDINVDSLTVARIICPLRDLSTKKSPSLHKKASINWTKDNLSVNSDSDPDDDEDDAPANTRPISLKRAHPMMRRSS